MESPKSGGASAGAGSGVGFISGGDSRTLMRTSSIMHREEALRTLSVKHGLVAADPADRPSNSFVSPLLTDMYQVSSASWLTAP